MVIYWKNFYFVYFTGQICLRRVSPLEKLSKLFSIRKSLTGQSQVYCCWRSILFSKRTRLGFLHSAKTYELLPEQIRVEQSISQKISFLKVHLRFGWTSNDWLTRGKVARSPSVSAKSLQLSQTL